MDTAIFSSLEFRFLLLSNYSVLKTIQVCGGGSGCGNNDDDDSGAQHLITLQLLYSAFFIVVCRLVCAFFLLC